MHYNMTNKIRFSKMHGAGNDYIYVDTTKQTISNPTELAIKWSKFHTGIGSDGLVLIGKSNIADFSMRIFNSDGSEAKMCGNASRCIGKFVYENGLTNKQDISLDTNSGIKYLKLIIEDKVVKKVSVDMGNPEIKSDILKIRLDNGMKFSGSSISMGNPHYVVFTNNIEEVNLSEIGPMIENHKFFPDRTNVEFAQITGNNTIRMRVWERGSGITFACGTGACATAVAAINKGLVSKDSPVIINMDGGSLSIEWKNKTNQVIMTGEATHVFDGEINL